MNKLLLLFWVSRPVSWLNTSFPFAVTYVILGDQSPVFMVIATIFFLIPYNILMYGVNDVFDYESDMKNPRKGGLEGALVQPHHHTFILWASTLLCLPFLLYMFVQANTLSNIILLLVMFMVVAYSAKGLRFKEVPFLDSVTSSTHFAGPFAYALSLTGHLAEFWPLVLSFFLWGMASHAFGAVQDVVPDREGGISSVATVWGAKRTVWFSLALYVGAMILLLFQNWPIPLAALAVAVYPISIMPYLNLTDASSAEARRGWKRFLWLNIICGFLLTQLIIFSHLLM